MLSRMSNGFKKSLKIIFIFVAISYLSLFILLKNPSFTTKSFPTNNVQTDARDIESTVLNLTKIQPPRQYKNKQSMQTAQDFIQNKLNFLGYKTELQPVLSNNYRFNNIVARYEGSSSQNKVIVIGAHYDVCGDQPGADDNASGVAGLLELARLLKKYQPKLETTIEIVAYSSEEPPFFGLPGMGSLQHAELLKKSGIQVKYMISLEMIGYFSEAPYSQDYPAPVMYSLYPSTGNFISIVGTLSDRELVKKLRDSMRPSMSIPVESINAPAWIPGIDFSDQRSYWQHEWTAVMITDTAFFRNKEYHKPGDTPDRLNYQAIAEVVRGLYSGIIALDQK